MLQRLGMTGAWVVAVAFWLATGLEGVDGGFGQMKVTEHFDASVASHFAPAAKRSFALRRAAKIGKPLLVIVTRRGCGACQNLKQSVNRGSEVKALLSEFVVVHAVDAEASQWQPNGHQYFPQSHFFAPGETDPLPILGSSEQSPYFFHDDETLAWGMKTAIHAVKTGQRSNPHPEL